MQAAILAIGSELTDGDLVNSNAAWLSARLREAQIPTYCHITVPDVPQTMAEAFDQCCRVAELIFVTGGLGPTSDDLTRQMLAKQLAKPLVYDQGSWQKIIERFRHLGSKPPPQNKQQCFFPEGARILNNTRGSANAFFCRQGRNHIWVLPGPPAELTHIWQEHMHDVINGFNLKKEQHRSVLHCLGISESHLAEIVEEKLSSVSWPRGYRSHFPIVEVKIWLPREPSCLSETDAKSYQDLIGALSQWLIYEGDQGVAQRLVACLPPLSRIFIDDRLSRGALLKEIHGPMEQWMQEGGQLYYSTLGQSHESIGKNDITFNIKPGEDGSTYLDIAQGDWHRSASIAPLGTYNLRPSGHMRFGMISALHNWASWLEERRSKGSRNHGKHQ